MAEFTVALLAELSEVAALYEACNYGGRVSAADATFICRVEKQIVGAVRLVQEDQVIVLRGMQVRRSHQRQGIGAHLLSACVPLLNEYRAYCLPYAHLVPFYDAASFRCVSETKLPSFLAERPSSYLARGQEVLAMVRTPDHHLAT